MRQVLKIEDLIGTTYNRFTILEEGIRHIEPSGKSQRVMVCECSCGTIKNVQLKELRRGDIKSCGCLAKEQKINIESNTIYNYWTILSEAEPYITTDGSKVRKVLAKCVCGAERELLLNSLRMGSSKSCGCMTEHKAGYQTVSVDSPIPEMTLEQMNQRKLHHWKIIELISAKRNENREIERTVVAQCKCGYKKEVKLDNINKSKQCFNCFMQIRNDRTSPQEKEVNKKLRGVYGAMKDRCANPNSKDYVSYGGRGIAVCDEWQPSIKPFKEWAINNGYQVGLELDRRDSNLGYSPENCRWVTKVENLLNMSSINLTIEDVKFIRSSEFDIDTMADNYTCSVAVIKRIMNYETFKNV